MFTTPDAAPPAFSRRTVLRTAAWTVPAVAVAVATPAMAASGEPAACLVFDGTGQLLFDMNAGVATVSPAAIAAVSGWLSDNGMSWPSGTSLMSATLQVSFDGTLDGAHFRTIIVSGVGSGPVSVLPDGSLPGTTTVLSAASTDGMPSFEAQTTAPDVPEGVIWTPTFPPEVFVSLAFDYSDDCSLTLTTGVGD